MIVHSTQTGWEVIYHRAHALLAAQIAGQWRKSDSPARLYETIAAISHHDDLEKEWEGNHLTAAGAPLDFTMDQGEGSMQKLFQHTRNARYRGRWVALLISKHMSRLNESQRGTSKELDAFLNEQIDNQKKWSKELNVTQPEIDRAYDFMQWCDRLSLILCQKELPADERWLEISQVDGQRYDIKKRADELLTVEPWCFQDDKFTVNVEAIDLHQIKFESPEELTKVLQESPVKVLEWTFIKS